MSSINNHGKNFILSIIVQSMDFLYFILYLTKM